MSLSCDSWNDFLFADKYILANKLLYAIISQIQDVKKEDCNSWNEHEGTDSNGTIQ